MIEKQQQGIKWMIVINHNNNSNNMQTLNLQGASE
jgi:hypothetical protein